MKLLCSFNTNLSQEVFTECCLFLFSCWFYFITINVSLYRFYFINVTDNTKEEMRWRLLCFSKSLIRMSQKDISVFQASVQSNWNFKEHYVETLQTLSDPLQESLFFFHIPSGKRTVPVILNWNNLSVWVNWFYNETAEWNHRVKWPALLSIWLYLSIPFYTPFISSDWKKNNLVYTHVGCDENSSGFRLHQVITAPVITFMPNFICQGGKIYAYQQRW